MLCSMGQSPAQVRGPARIPVRVARNLRSEAELRAGLNDSRSVLHASEYRVTNVPSTGCFAGTPYFDLRFGEHSCQVQHVIKHEQYHEHQVPAQSQQ
jgi:hypothetical protein